MSIKEILSSADDFYNSHGAGCLATAIEAYWHERGYTQVRVERYEISPGTWSVRSNLVNGMPPACKALPLALGVFKL